MGGDLSDRKCRNKPSSKLKIHEYCSNGNVVFVDIDVFVCN